VCVCVYFQLNFAFLLSLLYCLVQFIVLIGLIVQMARNKDPIYCDPNTMFFLFVTGTLLLCGLLHPREILAVGCGFVYYLSIPTMYLILMIYSFCNLHVVSWGTREVKKSPAEIQKEQEAALAKKADEDAKKKQQGTFRQIQDLAMPGADDDSAWNLQCGSCCKLMCCLSETTSAQRVLEYKVVIKEIEKLERSVADVGREIGERLDDMEYCSTESGSSYSSSVDDEDGNRRSNSVVSRRSTVGDRQIGQQVTQQTGQQVTKAVQA
jgi:chitin synthase